MATFFDMEMDDPRYGPTKPKKNAIRPKPLKRGTRKKRDKVLSDKNKMKSLSHDIFHDLKKTKLKKSRIEEEQDNVFEVIEKHNESLKKSPITISGRKSFAAIPPRTKLIISSRQDEPTQAQAFEYDNDPTAGMAPWQYQNFMAAKKKHDNMRRQRLLQHKQQMRANASDSDDDFAAMSDERRKYQEMKMLARQAKQKETQSGGKRRRKKTRKRKGKGKNTARKNLKFREIKKPTFNPTNKREEVFEIDVDAIIKDERKSQKLLNTFNKTVQEWKKTPFYELKKKRELSDLANQYEFQLKNRSAREMDDSLIQTKNPSQQHYAKIGKDKDGNIIIPKGFIVSSNTKPQSKSRKKGMEVLRTRAAAQAPRRIGIGGRRSRKKRKKLMCPKNCCGVPVDKCGCPVSCPHCNCPEIKRLRKLLKRTRKKCNKKRKKTRRRKAGKKVTSKRKPNALRRTRIAYDARRERQAMREQREIDHLRTVIIDGGLLGTTLNSFKIYLEQVLNNQQYQTRERYQKFNDMFGLLNRAIMTRRISDRDKGHIDLIGNLLRRLRAIVEPNFDAEHLGESSSSDEEATTENAD